MYEALLVLYLLIAISLIFFVILQQGKGADMGASLGASASATLFGSNGSGNFMTRTTATLAALFFVISLILGNMSSGRHHSSEWENLAQPMTSEKAVVPEISDKPEPSNDIPQ